jgi:hypothetical protein
LWAVVLQDWQQRSEQRRDCLRLMRPIELMSVDTYSLKRLLSASISTSNDRV